MKMREEAVNKWNLETDDLKYVRVKETFSTDCKTYILVEILLIIFCLLFFFKYCWEHYDVHVVFHTCFIIINHFYH